MTVTYLPHGGAQVHITLPASQMPTFEPWCRNNLQGQWWIACRYPTLHGFHHGDSISTTRIDLRVNTSEDLTLVQLTWL